MKRFSALKNRYDSLSLQKKMLLFTMPVLALFLATTFAIYGQTRRSLKEAVLSATELNFDLMVTEWNTKMQEVKNNANRVAANSVVRSYISAAEKDLSIEQELRNELYDDLFSVIVRSDTLQSIFILKSHTQFVASTPFQYDSGIELVTALYTDESEKLKFRSFNIDDEKTYFCYVQQLYRQSTAANRSYVILVIKPEYAKSLLKKYNSPNIDYFVSDEHSNILYATQNMQNDISSIQSILRTDEKIIETKKQIIIHEYLVDSSFSLVALISKTSLFKELVQYQNWTLFTNIGTCILLIISILVIFEAFSRRIEHLNRTMDLVAQGNYTTRSEFKADDEISKLGKKLNNMLDNLQSMVINASLRELELRKAQIDTMRYQISPHFMYNTLEAIRMIAIRNKDHQVSDIIKVLSKMLRYSSESPAIVDVRDEINQIERYLSIQSIRFKNKFSVEIDIAPELNYQKIPKLLLQPLIENAFKHGVEPKAGFSKLIITGSHLHQKMRFLIQDTGVGIQDFLLNHISQYIEGNSENAKYLGIGLRNVIDRIRLYYGSAGQIRIDSQIGQGTIIIIEIPGLLDDEDVHDA